MRRALSLFAVGWYLLVPKLSSPDAVNIQAPLSEWRSRGAFDLAAQCEAERLRVSEKEFVAFRDTPPAAPEWKLAMTNHLQASYSVCIASDDPRLKPTK